jgi:hypothetical protein
VQARDFILHSYIILSYLIFYYFFFSPRTCNGCGHAGAAHLVHCAGRPPVLGPDLAPQEGL